MVRCWFRFQSSVTVISSQDLNLWESTTIESFEKNYQLRHIILHHFCNSSYHTTKSEIAGSSFQLRSRVIKWCIDVMTDECSDMHLWNCIAAYFYRTERDQIMNSVYSRGSCIWLWKVRMISKGPFIHNNQ